MTLQISLDPVRQALLEQRAAAAGKDVVTFARDTLIEGIERPTLTEILAPVHEEARRRNVSAEETDGLIEREIRAHREDRRSGTADK